MTVSGAQRDLDAVRSGLERWFSRRHRDARVGPLTRPSVGYSSETLLFSVTATGEDGVEREEALVARLPPAGGGIFPTYDLSAQARVQEALGRAGVPVAEPVAVEEDDSFVGDPFFVMRRAPGWVLAERPSYVAGGRLFDASAQVQEAVHRSFLESLAALHRLDWDTLDLGFLTPPGERGLAFDVERAGRYLDWAADGSPPATLADAVEWCRANVPDPEPPLSLVWGDPRLGNVVFDEAFAAVALLDWEMASIGAAEMDLAWFVALHESSARTAGADLPGFLGHDDAVAVYEARLGRAVVDYRWFEVFSLLRSDSIFWRIRQMLLASGLDAPWLKGPSPGALRIASLIGSDPAS